MKKALTLLALATLWLAGACTTQIDADYPKYLANNEGAITFPETADAADYHLKPATEEHSYTFRSFMGGVGNSWVLDFGRILDATMNGEDMKTAFARVRKVSSDKPNGRLLLVFDLNSYAFEGFEARVAMTVTAQQGETQLVQRTYQANGISQGGKMYFGGAFTMKNAVQQSTKSAVDQIMTTFLRDLRKVYKNGKPIAETPAGPDLMVRGTAPRPGAS